MKRKREREVDGDAIVAESEVVWSLDFMRQLPCADEHKRLSEFGLHLESARLSIILYPLIHL